MNRKYIFYITTFVLLVLVFGVSVFVYVNKKTHQDVSFNFSNIRKIQVYSSTETTGDGDNKLVATINKSGDSISLRKFNSYIVKFDAKDNYEDGEKNITINQDSKSFDFKPYYSESTLEDLLSMVDNGVILSAFNAVYPDNSLYTLNLGKLYGDGSWYGTTLTYVGNDTFNDDMLLAVFHKENDTWVLKTTPPDITLSKYIYPEIPEDILRKVNKLSIEQ